MGTRADFYVGRGETAEWVGSIAWDGYPEGIMPHAAEKKRAWVDGPLMPAAAKWPVGAHLFDATTEQEFRERVARFFEYREDVTLPENGWPWPWENSQTTDYAYAFDGGKVYASCFGHQWFDPLNPPTIDDEDSDDDSDGTMEGGKVATFPNFKKDRHAPAGDKRSGVMVFGQ
jgi:hypothetical protein